MRTCTRRWAIWSQPRARRRTSLTLIVALAALPAAPARAQEGWRSDVAELLQRRARAVLQGDRSAFRSTMTGAAFVQARLGWFDRVQTLPVDHYSLEPDDEAYLDLADAAEDLPNADEVYIVPVIERIGFERIDARPSAEGLLLTVIRRGDRWLVAGDEALDEFGLFSARSLWDFGDVRSVLDDDVLAITRGSLATARRLTAEIQDAIARVERDWPLRWPGRTVVSIPSSSTELARIFGTTVDLGPFVAFASLSADRTASGDIDLGGPRVFLQPDTYFAQPESFQRQVLSHEMTHIAAGARAGAFTPPWLEEGIAVVYGEPGTPASARLAARVRAGTYPARLPEVHEFFLGSDDDIKTSYEASSSFVTYLRGRFGRDAPARFYAALGRESPVSFGTARYHLNQASRSALGPGFDQLERAWLRRLRERFG